MEKNKVRVEGSARHIHVTRETLDALFGPGYELNYKRELSQPGEYLCDERVKLEGPKGAIERVSILGPCRPITQVEVSLTDARALGIDAPIRESGDIAGSSPIKLTGPAGSVELKEGAIAAKRHIHLKSSTAEALGLKNKQIVSLRVGGERGLTFGEVVIRVSDKFNDAAHIDFDEMNAGAIPMGEVWGEIIVD